MIIVSPNLGAAKSFFRRQTALAALRTALRARRMQKSTRCARTVKAVSRVGDPSPIHIHSMKCERRLSWRILPIGTKNFGLLADD